MPFLTLEDPNAKIKGSRDPLGVQTIWVPFARHLVTNLTSQSTSVRGFTILLLGRYMAEQMIEDGEIYREDALDVFLRMEQLGAYARYIGHAETHEIRGIERVKRSLEEGQGRVTIQADRTGMILSDQKVYGLWGLYSDPARVSGLIPDDPVGVEKDARNFIIEHYKPALDKVRSPLRELLKKGKNRINIKTNGVLRSLIEILPKDFSPDEVSFYGQYLRDAKFSSRSPTLPATDLQERLVRLMSDYSNEELGQPLGREEAVSLQEKAKAAGDEQVARYLNWMIELESLLAPATALFGYIQTQDGQEPADVAGKLKNDWGTQIPNLDWGKFWELLPEIEKHVDDQSLTEIIGNCYQAMESGDYLESVRAVLKWNRKVMETRSTGPWIKTGTDGRIEVRYRSLEQVNPTGDELHNLWNNSYFINAVKSVTRQLRNVR